MNRYSRNINQPVIVDADRFFQGWNSKLHRSILPEGIVAKSINKRFTDRRASPRKGSMMPNGNRFWYLPDNSQKFIGSGLYINPAGKERLVLCPSTITSGTVGINVYDFENDRGFVLRLPDQNLTIGPNSQVWFASGFGSLIMLISDRWHGKDGPHVTNGMFWNGDESVAGQVFQWFSWNNAANTQVIPPSLFAVPTANRMAYWSSYLPPTDVPRFFTTGPVTDHVLISDPWGSAEQGPFQNMDPVKQDFTVNAGSTDQIVAVVPYANDTLIVGMKRSISALTNFSIDPNLALTQVLTSYMGIVGPRAILQIGTEVYFVTERLGLFKLSTAFQQQIVIPPLPISDDIQPDIDRINWKYGYKIILAAEENYLFMAAPIDGATSCNAIFVKNLTTDRWEGIDRFTGIPNFSIDNLIAIHINGVRRLIGIQNGPPSLIYLLYEGAVDQTVFDVINPRYAPVSDYMETRGYGLNKDLDPAAWANFRRGSIVTETQNPNIQISAITEGVNEVKILRPSITKDRTKFYIHGKPDWFPGNDPLAEKRQDYTLPQQPPGNYAAQDFESVPVGPINLQQIEFPLGPVGQDPFDSPKQTSREPFPIRMTDRWVSLGIANSQGTCTIVASSVEMIGARRNARTAA